MITGIHAIVYSRHDEKIRAFFGEKLNFRSVDAGGGWPIFEAPPAELAVHPTDGEPEHEIFLMCDDIEKTLSELRQRGVQAQPVHERSWGMATVLEVASGETIGLYEPRHPSPLSPSLHQLTHDLFQLIDDVQSGKVPWSRFDEIVTPDFKAFVPGQTLDVNGFKQVMQSFSKGFSGGSHRLFDMVCNGETAMVREEWSGTHTGEFLGAQPTGKRVTSLVMCLVRFKDGKISEFHET